MKTREELAMVTPALMNWFNSQGISVDKSIFVSALFLATVIGFKTDTEGMDIDTALKNSFELIEGLARKLGKRP